MHRGVNYLELKIHDPCNVEDTNLGGEPVLTIYQSTQFQLLDFIICYI